MTFNTRLDSEIIAKIIYALESLEFGTVQITVHDSQVTQIEKVEKHRFQLQKNKSVTKQEKQK